MKASISKNWFQLMILSILAFFVFGLFQSCEKAEEPQGEPGKTMTSEETREKPETKRPTTDEESLRKLDEIMKSKSI